MEQARTLWSVGHSSHPWEAFVAMLRAGGIEAIADVRLLAGSRRHPQFNADAMAIELPKLGIDNLAFRDLGGPAPPRKDSHNTAWRKRRLPRLCRLHGDRRLPTRTAAARGARPGQEDRGDVRGSGVVACHRSLISDDFKADGWTVLHCSPLGG